MNYIIKNLQNTDKYQEILKSKKSPITISGLVSVAKPMIISALKTEERKPIIIVTYNEIEARDIIKNLEFFTTNENIYFFPKKEISLYDYDAGSIDTLYERINVLNKINSKKNIIIVTTIEAIMQKLPKREVLYENIIGISDGQTLEYNQLKEKLVNLGYQRADLIEARGQFSIRGDIIDISLNDKEGIRIEFWGDNVDSIRKFDIKTQRSIETITTAEIYPATENILEKTLEKIATKIEEKYPKELSDVEAIKNGDYESKIDKYFNEFYEQQETLLDYAKDYKIFLDEPEKIKLRIKTIIADNANLFKEIRLKEKHVPERLENIIEYKYDLEELENKTYLLKEGYTKENNFDFREVNIFSGDKKELEEIIENHKKNKIIILSGNSENSKKISSIIPNSVIRADLDSVSINPGSIVIAEGNLTTGFENKETNLLVLSSQDFFGVKKKKRKSHESFNNAEKIVFADMKIGDMVVHREHGIGIFVGVQTINNDGIIKDYIQIRYRDGDTLYVPTDSLDNVRKYIGSESGIKLNKLGTKEWVDIKNKVKRNLRTVAKELIELYARREKERGYAFSKDTPWQEEFEANFQYQETDDQIRCINEVKQDMESIKPMDRLLCGDVGYGKTEVAIRAAFKAVMDGKQVAYLAPTTVLANQQYLEFKQRMKEYPISVDLLNRFRTQKEQKNTVKEIEDRKVDIVIGTHRLLSKDVKFNDLGLLIIDEEQRFGVKDKEKIKQYKSTVDVLTMTATPIPRTLQMSVVGIRDMSAIYEPPHDRKPIQTYVLEYDKEIIREAITRELERGGQVFYIYNIVSTIENKAQEIEKLVPEAKVAFAHGQMSGTEIENIMQDFVDKKTNVLVCTTILESGIDIPNANTMIVENADRFGLAQLYQIRGRVGRSTKQAYAYITYRKDKMITYEANQRLKAIKEFIEFGSGFKIATRDLQIRGAGSIFGEVQSGHIEQVGYDMYSKLLNEVVKEEKGEKVIEEIEVQIDIGISSFIPDNYIESSSQKIEIYQDIANCRTEADIMDVIDEITDRYGDMPKEVENLIEIARIKNIARPRHIVKIQEKQMGFVFTFADDIVIEAETISKLLKQYKNNIHFSAIGKPYITLKIEKNKIEEIKKFILNFDEMEKNDNNK